jgi:hypothetical protein
MAKRQGDINWRFVQVSAPQLELWFWLGVFRGLNNTNVQANNGHFLKLWAAQIVYHLQRHR